MSTSKIQVHILDADVWHQFGKHLRRLSSVVAGRPIKPIAQITVTEMD